MPTQRSPKRPFQGRTTKRPSPILIPGNEKPSLVRRIGAWIRGFGRTAKAPLPAAVEPDLPDDSTIPEPSELEVDLDPKPEPEEANASSSPEAATGHRATVQMLPGRLEPLLPEVIQQEIRFQRGSGLEQEVTLGWELGEPPHHVTLDHPSIQPLHAKMTFQRGNWMIESLATNDPVEINGTPVPASAGPYLLASGDQVRIGEALFRFFLP